MGYSIIFGDIEFSIINNWDISILLGILCFLVKELSLIGNKWK